MKTVCIMVTLLLAEAGALAGKAQNLFPDPEFDHEDLLPFVRLYEGKAQGRLTHQTEDGTWNRCVKLELLAFHKDKKGYRHVGCSLALGGDKTGIGIPCKASTTYEFSLEVRGQAPRAMLNAYEWSKLPDTPANRKKTRTSIHLIRPQREWTQYRGTFQTSSTARRMALCIQFWGNETQKNLEETIGDAIWVDKLSIREAPRNSAFGTSQANRPTVEPAAVYVAPTSRAPQLTTVSFVDSRTGEPARTLTQASVLMDRKELIFDIHCKQPPQKAACHGQGDNQLWQDDLLEVFLDSVTPDRPLNQFVVSAGGGRWMNTGAQADYDQWSASVRRHPDGWSCQIRIPYTTIGYAKPPRVGDHIRFNLCRQQPMPGIYHKPDFTVGNRLAGNTMVYNSAFSFTMGNNHDKNHFGTLFFGSFKPYYDHLVKTLAPERNHPELSSLFAELDVNQPAKTFALLEQLREKHRIIQLKKRKFIITQVPCDVDPSIPFLPMELNEPSQKIFLRAAQNEQLPVALALANMTGQAEEYRISIVSGWFRPQPQQEHWTTHTGLESRENRRFDSSKIAIRRGIRAKDSDGVKHGQRFDALVRLNEASTVLVPSQDATLLWLKFDCRDVIPGLYKGTLLITPQYETYTGFKHRKAGYDIQDATQSLDIELEILPFSLPEISPMPLNGYRTCYDRQQGQFMKNYDCFMYMASPWYFTFSFKPDGSLHEKRVKPYLHPQLKLLADLLKTHKPNPKVMVGYSAYMVFKNNLVPKSIPVDSSAYWNAWRHWCQGVSDIMAQHGFENNQWTMEIFDEPDPLKVTHKELARAHQEARKACPKMRIMITSGILFYDDVKELVDEWVFSYYALQRKDYRKKAEDFRKKPGKHVSVYGCGTSMRQDLYRYYRLMPWYAQEINADSVSLFQFFEQIPALNFRSAPKGGVAYVTHNGLIPSVRLENLQLGMTDIKYLAVLKAMATGNSNLHQKARIFLQNAPREIAVISPHDRDKTRDFRRQAIDLILKLQEKQ